ncbi:hypothetical protein DFH28DRAFT_961879 [Melampsora americana]|nr:hypothetical protein DFH28DRAFT_961879 [Melampsora americana]
MQNQITIMISAISFLYLHLDGIYCFSSSLKCLDEASKSRYVNKNIKGPGTTNLHWPHEGLTEGLSEKSEGDYLTPNKFSPVKGNQLFNRRIQLHNSKAQQGKDSKPHEIVLKPFEDPKSFRRVASKKPQLKFSGVKEPSKIESLTPAQNMHPGNENNSGSAHRVDIRRLPQENLNGLCVQFTKHLSKEFCTEVRQLFNSFATKKYPPEASNTWNQETLSPMVYFLVMRNPTKSQWNRIQSISAYFLLTFYEMDPEAAKDPNSEKRFQFLLWHTEMMYHLTNPSLLHYVNQQEEQSINDDVPVSKFRSNSRISQLLLLLANEGSFKRRLKYRPRFLETTEGFLSDVWIDDYKNNYPHSSNSNKPIRVIQDEWMEISRKISAYSSIGNMNKYSLSSKEDQPMISIESLREVFGLATVDKYFLHDLKDINSKREDIRKDFMNLHRCNILDVLGIWMKSHHEQHVKFSDPFGGTALLSYIDPTRSDTSFEFYFTQMQRINKRKASQNKAARDRSRRKSEICLEDKYFGVAE